MSTQRYFSLSLAVDAPRDRVFRAWIDPREVCRWYGCAPFVYHEVDAPARLVFTTGGPDDDPQDPYTPVAIVTLSEAGDHTAMTFEGSAPAAEADAVQRGWSAMLDRLVAQVSQSGGNTGGMRPG